METIPYASGILEALAEAKNSTEPYREGTVTLGGAGKAPLNLTQLGSWRNAGNAAKATPGSIVPTTSCLTWALWATGTTERE